MVSAKIEKIFRVIWYLVAFMLTIYLGYTMWKGNEELPYNIIIFITNSNFYIVTQVK